MNYSQFTHRQNSGSVLLVSLVIGAVLCAMLGSFLLLTRFEYTTAARSQAWNTAMVAAEAGLEEGLSMINRFADGSAPLTSWPDANRPQAAGWSVLTANVYLMERTIDSNSKYKVYITNLNSAPIVKSVGYALLPQKSDYVSRAVTVNTAAGSFFLGGVLAKKDVNINGSAIIDSYNSQDPKYSTLGQWDVTKRKDGGNVGSVQSNVVAAVISSGNAKIYGQIATGPNSTISVSGNADAGSLAWVNAGNKGIQPGWSRNDLNISIPDAPALPAGTYQNLPAPGNVVLQGGTPSNPARYTTSTAYQMNSHNYLLITNGTVVIDAQQGVALNAQAAIQIATNAQLILYLGTQNTQLDGQGVMNNTGYPTNFIVYGKNNNKQIEINGGSAFVGYVYAPYADITLNGNSDNSGAMVGSSFQINGNMGLHYDESLSGPQSGTSIYRILAWRETIP